MPRPLYAHNRGFRSSRPVLPVTAGLTVDLDASVGVSADANNNVVSWSNQAGTGQTAFGLANKPLLLPQDANFNNQPSVLLNAAGRLDYLDIGGNPPGVTVVLVMRSGPGRDGKMLWAFATDVFGSGTYDLWNQYGNLLGLNNFAGNCYGSDFGQAYWDSPSLMSATLEANNFASFMQYANGTAFAPNQGTANSQPIGRYFSLGRCLQTNGSDASGYATTAWFARCLVYSRVLAAQELADVHAHLKALYGTP